MLAKSIHHTLCVVVSLIISIAATAQPARELAESLQSATQQLNAIAAITDIEDQQKQAADVLLSLRPHINDLALPDEQAKDLWLVAARATVLADDIVNAPLVAAMVHHVHPDFAAEHPELASSIDELAFDFDYKWMLDQRKKARELSLRAETDPEAMTELAEVLAFHTEMMKDIHGSMNVLRRAAEMKYPRAAGKLGAIYIAGLSGTTVVRPDPALGIKLLQQAVDGGDPEALCNLGVAYLQGLGVEQDVTKAVELFSKAVELESTLGMVFLGNLYREGLGVEQDATKALELWRQAASLNNPQAILKVGKAFLE